MRYLCLIYQDEAIWQKMAATQADQLYREYLDLIESMKQSGQYLGGNPLESTQTATTVRVRQGKISATDGPFAETKEQLGGYILVEAKDLDEAIRIASKIPGARIGSIEVRPVREINARSPLTR